MRSNPTVSELVQLQRQTLALEWLAGKGGAHRELKGDTNSDPSSLLVSHLNLIRPYRVQVLGTAECEYLRRLSQPAAEDIVAQLFDAQPVCVLVANGLPATDSLVRHADHTDTPLLSSRMPSQKVVGDLQYFLAQIFARRTTIHGVFMEVMGAGTLLTGQSGVGKSELALELLTRGHRLIADDITEFALMAPDTLEGTCPEVITNFMEVRGLGIVNVRALFGDSAVKLRKNLRLIIHLEPMQTEQVKASDRLRGLHRKRKILGVETPEVTLPVAPGRNMAVLVECTVRDHLLRLKGYDAVQDFEELQRRMIQRPHDSDGVP